MKLHQVQIALDQLLNTVLFHGWADETLSARAHRNAAQGHSRWTRVQRFIDSLFFWEKHHCYRSYCTEQSRAHLPPSYRDALEKWGRDET